MAKTVTALYQSMEDVRDTVQQLIENGFQREQISVIVPETHTGTMGPPRGEGQGEDSLELAKDLLDQARSLELPEVGLVVMAGPVIGALAGTGTQAGSLVGAMTAMGVPEQSASSYVEGLKRGATVVIAAVADHVAAKARLIMDANRAMPVGQTMAQGRGMAGGSTRSGITNPEEGLTGSVH